MVLLHEKQLCLSLNLSLQLQLGDTGVINNLRSLWMSLSTDWCMASSVSYLTLKSSAARWDGALLICRTMRALSTEFEKSEPLGPQWSSSNAPHPTSLSPEKPICRSRNNRTRHGTTDWFQIRKGVWQGWLSQSWLSPWLFNLYAEYIMQNARLDESHGGVKTAGRNINNLRYADDSTLLAES